MPRTIVKPDRRTDLYVEWSSVVDAPTAYGPREWMLDYLSRESSPASVIERLDRTDVNGSSDLSGMNEGFWDDGGFIYQQQGWLPRARLAELIERLDEKGEDADVTDLLEPFDDEEQT